MAVKFSNNAATLLAANATTSDTTLTVSDGSVFPTLSGSDHTYVTLEDVNANREIVKVTAISGNNLTVVRAQDGTTARAFSAADKCELRVIAALLNDLNTDADTESVSKSGDTMTGNLSLGDNVKAQFGASNDLQIYHNGSYSVIKEAGLGDLEIQTNGSEIQLTGNAGTDYMLRAISNGAVKLYYDNEPKIATNSSGISVTGDITLGDTNPTITFNDSSVTNLSHTILSASNNLRITSDANSVDSGSRVEIFDGSTEVARFSSGAVLVSGSVTADGLTVDGDVLVNRTSSFTNAAVEVQDDGSGEVLALNNNGTDGQFLRLYNSGTLIGGLGNNTSSVSSLNIYRGSTPAINIASNGDISFYNDSAAQGLFWDSSASTLGIGTTATNTLHGSNYGTTKLHIDGGTDRGQLIIQGDSLAQIVMSDNGATANSRVFITQVNDGVMIFKSLSDNGTSKATIMSMTSAGATTFSGSVSAPNVDITGALFDSAVNRGLKFDSTSVKPSNGSGGDANNHVDLGTTSTKFKNLYLSGTISSGVVTSTGLTVDGSTQFNTGAAGVAEFYHTSGLGGLRVTGSASGSASTIFLSNDKSGTPFDIYSFWGNGSDDSLEFFSGGSPTTGTKRLKLANNGDISFYNGSGNQGLFWDSSASSLGIGTTVPARPLTVNGLAGFRNSTTGFGTNDGFDIGVGGSDAYIVQRENANIIIETNGAERLRIKGDGSSVFSGSVSATAYDANSNSGTAFRLGGGSDGSTHIGNLINNAGRLSLTGAGSRSVVIRTGSTTADTLVANHNNNVNIPNGSLMVGATTAPTDKLEIRGNAKIEQTSNVDAILRLNPNSGTIGSNYRWELVGRNSAENYNFQIRQGATPYLTINNSIGGNAGAATFSGSVTAAGLTVNGNLATVGVGGSSAQLTEIRLDATSNSGYGGFIRGRKGGSSQWLFGDTASALGSGTGLINYVYGDNPTSFYNNGQLALNINGSQNVNIPNGGLMVGATTAPSAPITIKSNSFSASNSGLVLQGNTNTNTIVSIGEKSTDGARFHMYDGGVEKIAFYTDGTANHISAGNLGIGTSSPSGPLHVSGSDSTVPIKISNTGTGGDTWRIWSTSDAASDGGGKLGFYNEDTATRAMTLDSSGSVGIGTSSPDDDLHIANTTQAGATFRLENTNTSTDTNTTFGTINFEGNDNSAGANGIRGSIVGKSLSTNGAMGLLFSTASGGGSNTERMRIDSSGNVNVGCTDGNSLYNNSGTNDGAGILANGQIQQAVYQDVVHYVNRTGNDGTITSFQKDGSTVGSIGVNSTTPYMSGNLGGFRLTSSAGAGVMIPTDTSGNASDADNDLGMSSVRWRDLYLSSGVYLGGTGAANKLSDFETGSWNPSPARYTGGAITATYNTQDGYYTKVGNLVTCSFMIKIASISSQGSSLTYISGLPYAPARSYYDAGVTGNNSGIATVDIVSLLAHIDSRFYMRQSGSTHSNASADWAVGELSGTITYKTNS
jgi:hypothetical protein